MKVYLQFPWKVSDSTYYTNIINYPPKGIVYNVKRKKSGIITSKKKFKINNKIKELIRVSLNKINLPIPNAHKTNYKGHYDLIHCAHCLSLNKRPWVADFEGVWQMWVSGDRTKRGKKIVQDIIEDKNCKKIMCWCDDTKKEFLKTYPKIEKKLEIVYPAFPLKKVKKKLGKKIKILYAARYFWLKGGLISLKVLDFLLNKYKNLEVVFISDVPKEIKEKYPKIQFFDLLPKEKMFEQLKTADIFFYPSLVDTFGFTVLEAMSFGIPIISVNTIQTHARKEMMQDKINGFLIEVSGRLKRKSIGKEEEKLVRKLIEKTSILIENKKLREKMSKNCIKLIKNGKFSIKNRNKKLKSIYTQALKEK